MPVARFELATPTLHLHRAKLSELIMKLMSVVL